MSQIATRKSATGLGADGILQQLDELAAFDQLQWDFDLADVAQRADAVVFGALLRRSGQARSAVDRFLDECKRAVRVFDMTGCNWAELDRNDVLSGLRHATVVVVDDSPITRSSMQSCSASTLAT